MNTFTAALAWHQAGASVVPAATDGTKRPLGEWKQYQRERASLATLVQWFKDGHPGIGIIPGQVSGDLEMMEFEGRAVDDGYVQQFQELAENSGLGDVWAKLMFGYVEETPSKGLHFVYRVDGAVHGNTKLARRPTKDGVEVLIETRGEGGFVIVAPSHGPVHPTGRPWTSCSGSPAALAELTAEERDAMHDVARALDGMPQPEPFTQPARPGQAPDTGELKPGDDYEARTSWADILQPLGWQLLYTQGHTSYWRRPGKNLGISATTGRADDRDRLFVFSTSTEFEAETPYTKFAAYALLHHGGDYKAAARALADKGYGERRTPQPTAFDPPKPPAMTVADDPTQNLRQIVAVRGDTLEVKPTYWLWRDRFPLGGLSLLAGKGEVSKSTVFAQFVAWLTTGKMKGFYYETPVDIAYVGNEDLLNETVVPRMLAHGADMSKVHFLTVATPTGEDALTFPQDEELMKEFIRSTGVVATFIDPLSANVTGKKNDQGETRRTYQRVSRIAQDTGTSIIGLAHTRKAGAQDVAEALMGSIEQVNIARSLHGLVMDPEEDGARILSYEKSNLTDKTKLPSLRFRLESVGVPCTDGSGLINQQPRIEWLPEISETASDILGDALVGNEGADECARWLYDYLVSQGGQAHFADIQEAAGKKFSVSMLKRARKKIDVMSVRTRSSRPQTIWSLPVDQWSN